MRNIKIFKSLLLLLFLAIGTNAFAQATSKKRPDAASDTGMQRVGGLITGYNTPSVEERNKAFDLDEASFSTVKSYGGTALSIGNWKGKLTLDYTNSSNHVPANSKFYLKVNSEEANLLDALIGGALGDFLKGALNVAIGGDHVTHFRLKNASGNNVISVSTNNSNNNPDKINFAVDGTGKNYFAVFYPKQAVKTIEVEDETTFNFIFGDLNKFRVYDAFHYDNVSDCDIPLLTSFTAAGNLISFIQSNPVENSHYAIDNDPNNTYSTLGIRSLFNISAIGSIEQYFHLPTSVDNKTVSFKVQMPSSLLKMALNDRSAIVFYNNGAQVGKVDIDQSILGFDFLGLINQNNATFSFTAAPRDANGHIIAFDKVGIRINKTASFNLLNAEDIRVYDVALVDAQPEEVKVCARDFMNGNIRERKFDLTQMIPNYNPATEYVVVNAYQVSVPFKTAAEKAANKWQPLGAYYIKGVNASGYCPKQYSAFIVVQDPQYKITGKAAISLPLDADGNGVSDAAVKFDPALYQSNLPGSNGVVRIYDEITNADVTGQTVQYTKIGTYNYYAISKNATNDANVTCDVVKRITVYVYDQEECDYRYVQRMATNKKTGLTFGGGTTDSALAADKDLSTAGKIWNLWQVAGIGTSWIDLTFDNVAAKPIPRDTPLTVKLGQGFGLFQLMGGITIQPLDRNGNTVGGLIFVDGIDILNLAVGDNVYEYTFIPKNPNGVAIEYGGVRVILGGLLGVGNEALLFGAYIDERIPVGLTDCKLIENIEINGATTPAGSNKKLSLNTSTKDVLYGVKDIGFGMGTSLSGVKYPYLATDAVDTSANPSEAKTPNFETAAIFDTSFSVMNQQSLTVKFKDVARPGDKVRIIMSSEGISLLNVSFLKNFTIQRYMGNIPIGDEVHSDAFEIVKFDFLRLVSDQKSNKHAIVLEGIGASFDRVELRMRNVFSADALGPKTHIWDVSVLPYFEFDNSNNELCTSAPLVIERLDPCTEYDLSFAYATLGTVINPVTGEYDVLGWNDIPNSSIKEITSNDPRYSDDEHKYQLNKLHKEYSKDNNLYLKVVTKRQGCVYGDTQYLRVIVKNCSSLVNPMIRTRLKNN